ncbi:hypothetical protein EBR66_01665 [bacterium]|nr:hypothetical protein [bacterium]
MLFSPQFPQHGIDTPTSRATLFAAIKVRLIVDMRTWPRPMSSQKLLARFFWPWTRRGFNYLSALMAEWLREFTVFPKRTFHTAALTEYSRAATPHVWEQLL